MPGVEFIDAAKYRAYLGVKEDQGEEAAMASVGLRPMLHKICWLLRQQPLLQRLQHARGIPILSARGMPILSTRGMPILSVIPHIYVKCWGR